MNIRLSWVAFDYGWYIRVLVARLRIRIVIVYVYVILNVYVCRENGWRGDSTIGIFGQFGSPIAPLELRAEHEG